jgi:hypothetical protein
MSFKLPSGAQAPYETSLNVLRVNSLGVGSYNTIQSAINAAPAVSEIEILNEVEHDETLTLTTSKVNLRGVGAKLSTRITGVGAGSTGLTINGAYDVLLENLNVSGRTTGSGLKLTGQIRRVHAVDCRFAGGANGVLIEASSGGQVGDVTFERCIFEGVDGIKFTAGGGDPAFNIVLKDCILRDCTGRWVYLNGIHVTGLNIKDCSFAPNAADGSAPATKGITASFTGTTGVISGCDIAYATNASAFLEIASGVFWTSNKTEAGVSTARPA